VQRLAFHLLSTPADEALDVCSDARRERGERPNNSLHDSEDWRDVLASLAKAARDYVYVAQLPTVRRTASFVAVQRPYAHGYDTEYLGWILNPGAFLETVASASSSSFGSSSMATRST
jgi:hypothetical protein